MIEINNLTKKFNNKVLFDSFNLEIKDGEMLCISGDSGTGKTTLLNIIGQIEPYDSGEILYDGKAITSRGQRLKLFREDLGFVFQNYVLVENKTIKENLELIRTQDRTGSNMDEILEDLGLGDKKDQKVYELSGGEQQRVAMARLYLKKCKYVLADEPIGSLDKKMQKKF